MSSLLVEYAFYTFDHSTPSLGINIYTMKKYAELHHSHITYAKGNSNYGNLNTQFVGLIGTRVVFQRL